MKCKVEKLDWHVRVKITIGVARALAWLHDFNNFMIVHLDICSRSILLDKYYVPKISNFGGAMHRRSNDKGLIASSKIGELELIKQDVYQFGILLIGHDVQLVASNQTPNICKCACSMHYTQTCTRVDRWLHVPCTQTCEETRAVRRRGSMDGLCPLSFICIL